MELVRGGVHYKNALNFEKSQLKKTAQNKNFLPLSSLGRDVYVSFNNGGFASKTLEESETQKC